MSFNLETTSDNPKVAALLINRASKAQGKAKLSKRNVAKIWRTRPSGTSLELLVTP